MSEGLPKPDNEELKPQSEQNTPNPEGGENVPCYSKGGKRPEKERGFGNHNESEPGWRKWAETIFKVLELAAFIAIILTFLEMRKTRIDDERAWISIFPPISNYSNNVWTHTVKYKNIGKTPALHVFTEFHVLFTNDFTLINPTPQPSSNSGGYLFPDIESRFSTTTHNAMNSVNPVYGIGCIWYSDIFGRRHWVRFNWIMTPDGLIYPAATGNDCDENN